MRLIKLKSLITHTYPWEQEVLIGKLKRAIEASEEMIKIYERIKERIKPYLH